jgi:hypothetical protein
VVADVAVLPVLVGGRGELRAAAGMTATIPYGPSPTRERRTKAAMESLRAALLEIIEQNQPVTVRQTFYLAVSAGLIRKTETEYKATVGRLLTEMRRAGELPYGWIADNTRWMRKPSTYSSLDGFLASAAQHYRRALWDTQDAYVEVWLEKDALAGVLFPVTAQWDVPLMVTRGYPSITFLHDAAETIADEGKPAFLYYFGDHDPSGVDIPRKVEADLRTFVAEYETQAEIHFQRVAVQPWQIAEWDLPTRPTKHTDTRARNFEGDSVEVDAIPPDILRALVEGRIEQHVDGEALDVLRRAEAHEREALTYLAQQMVGEG